MRTLHPKGVLSSQEINLEKWKWILTHIQVKKREKKKRLEAQLMRIKRATTTKNR